MDRGGGAVDYCNVDVEAVAAAPHDCVILVEPM